MPEQHYSCMYCNKYWPLDDPGFVYWRVADTGPWKGQNLDGRDGKPRSSLGWWAHCADKDACAQRKRNNRAGVAQNQMAFGVRP